MHGGSLTEANSKRDEALTNILWNKFLRALRPIHGVDGVVFVLLLFVHCLIGSHEGVGGPKSEQFLFAVVSKTF